MISNHVNLVVVSEGTKYEPSNKKEINFHMVFFNKITLWVQIQRTIPWTETKTCVILPYTQARPEAFPSQVL